MEVKAGVTCREALTVARYIAPSGMRGIKIYECPVKSNEAFCPLAPDHYETFTFGTRLDLIYLWRHLIVLIGLYELSHLFLYIIIL